ncbi:hypothetical protein NPIL_286141 [Nephila pilipes]|uniref:Uncharacterized protein n=1 Tax=Nephila pilipes TaxID=299642 RepID=A0A8X6P3N0_NEPPI|nr:hypothetical protein NPIL_286141 [Nephila pilipes]
MDTNNDQQNEMDYNEDSRSTISSISAKSEDTSSSCKRKQLVELQIRNLVELREIFRSKLDHSFYIHKDYEHPDCRCARYAIEFQDKELKRLEATGISQIQAAGERRQKASFATKTAGHKRFSLPAPLFARGPLSDLLERRH